MDWVRLEGPFQVGSQVTMKPKGQDPITSVILEATENQAYADQLDPDDSRARRLRLTAEGRRLARRAITAVEDADARFFGTEAAEATALLQRLLGPGLPRDRATAPAGGGA
jgi:hypothetical protein